MERKVLFLLPYPLRKAPSQRFRVEAYFDLLKENNISYSTQEFLDEAAWQILYKQGSIIKKAIAVLKGFLKRLRLVFFGVSGYSYIFIHREAAPIGPPFFEWFLAKVKRKKIIYDFDDAIWIPNTSKENWVASWVKAFWKVRYICRWSYKVACGNQYLCDYARRYNSQVVLLPTCVDTKNRYNQLKFHGLDPLVIGWTGSHSTMHYLNDVVPVLQKIVDEFGSHVIIISNKEPGFKLPNMKFQYWKETSEVEDLLQFDIGIMPLKKDAWSEGKCGFKLIQYLALGIPAITTPIGVNTNIVDTRETGFFCETENEWYLALKELIMDKNLREEMGKKGRCKIVNQFSLGANGDIFLNLFS